jgi:hypothetical protein
MLSDGILHFRLLLDFVLQMPISCRKYQRVCVSALPARRLNKTISAWPSGGVWGPMQALVRGRVAISRTKEHRI